MSVQIQFERNRRAPYKSPERKRLEADCSYHESCAAQYSECIARLPSERMQARAEANARFHDAKLAQAKKELERCI